MTYDNVFNSNVIASFPEKFGWNLVKRKYKTWCFEGDASLMSIESVCINNKEEENIDNMNQNQILTVVKKNIQV